MEEVTMKEASDTLDESTFEEELVQLNQKELRAIAEKARAAKKQKVEGDKKYDDPTVQKYVDELSGFVMEFAKEGYFYVEYNCSKLPSTLTQQIASMFKKQNPEIVVIYDGGRNYVICDWSGKNEV